MDNVCSWKLSDGELYSHSSVPLSANRIAHSARQPSPLLTHLPGWHAAAHVSLCHKSAVLALSEIGGTSTNSDQIWRLHQHGNWWWQCMDAGHILCMPADRMVGHAPVMDSSHHTAGSLLSDCQSIAMPQLVAMASNLVMWHAKVTSLWWTCIFKCSSCDATVWQNLWGFELIHVCMCDSAWLHELESIHKWYVGTLKSQPQYYNFEQ